MVKSNERNKVEKKELIQKIESGKTKGGKPTLELYGAAWLEYPVLTLIDANRSMLFDVGIDPNEIDGERLVRFWGVYTESEKKTKDGNPYKDPVRLEPYQAEGDAPADPLVAAVQALVQEVKLLRAVIQAGQPEEVVQAMEAPPPEAPKPASSPAQRPGKIKTMNPERFLTVVNDIATGKEKPVTLYDTPARMKVALAKVLECPEFDWPQPDDLDAWRALVNPAIKFLEIPEFYDAPAEVSE